MKVLRVVFKDHTDLVLTDREWVWYWKDGVLEAIGINNGRMYVIPYPSIKLFYIEKEKEVKKNE